MASSSTIKQTLGYTEDTTRFQCRGTNQPPNKSKKEGPRCGNHLSAATTLEVNEASGKFPSDGSLQRRDKYLCELAFVSLCPRHTKEDIQVFKLVEKLKVMLRDGSVHGSPVPIPESRSSALNAATTIERPIPDQYLNNSTLYATPDIGRPVRVTPSSHPPLYTVAATKQTAPACRPEYPQRRPDTPIEQPREVAEPIPSHTHYIPRPETPVQGPEQTLTPPPTPVPAPPPVEDPEALISDMTLQQLFEQLWAWANHPDKNIADRVILSLQKPYRDIQHGVRELEEEKQAIEAVEIAKAKEAALAAAASKSTAGEKKRHKVPIGWKQISDNRFVREGERATRSKGSWPVGWSKCSDGLWEEIDLGDLDDIA